MLIRDVPGATTAEHVVISTRYNPYRVKDEPDLLIPACHLARRFWTGTHWFDTEWDGTVGAALRH